MDIKDFVRETLQQIEEAIVEASNKSDNKLKYELDNYTSKGVHFNLAVTNTESSTSSSKKGGGIRIKVVQAEGNNEKEVASSAERISRIEFNIKSVDTSYQPQTSY